MSAISYPRFTALSLVVSSLVVSSSGVAIGQPEPAAAGQPDEVTVGVVVAVTNISDIEASLLTGKLGQALAKNFAVKVVAGDDAATKLPNPLPDGCLADIECLRGAAKALDVQRLLMLVAFRVGEGIQVDATHFSVAKDTSESRPTIRVSTLPSEWGPVFNKAAPTLLPGLSLTAAGPDGSESNGTEVGNDLKDGTGNGDVTSGSSDRGLPTSVKVVGAAAILTTAVASGFGLSVLNECGLSRACKDGDTGNQQLIADVIGVAGAILVVTTVVLYFKADRTPDAGDGLSLRTGPGDLGLAIGASF